MHIYTRTGDHGETGLLGGARVSKSHPRLEAYGTLDELNSVLGVLRLHISEGSRAKGALERIQQDLFALGAQLATPPQQQSRLEGKLTQSTWAIPEIEADIDRLMQLAPPLASFVLPAGCPGSAHAHWARTLCRRAERQVVALSSEEAVEPGSLVYLNRLSDWLFALARAENAVNGVPDQEWKP